MAPSGNASEASPGPCPSAGADRGSAVTGWGSVVVGRRCTGERVAESLNCSEPGGIYVDEVEGQRGYLFCRVC